MLSHAGDTLPCTAQAHPLEHQYACMLDGSKRAALSYPAILQDDGLHRHPGQEGSCLEGQEIPPIGGGALQSVRADVIVDGMLHRRERVTTCDDYLRE